MRDVSKYKSLRVALSTAFANYEVILLAADKDEYLASLEQAFYFAMIISYAQGMHLLSKASAEYKYELNLASIAKIWRGGCIIRSAFLQEIYSAFSKNNELEHLLLDDQVQALVKESLPGARKVVAGLFQPGLPFRLMRQLLLISTPSEAAICLPTWYRHSVIILEHIPMN
jgi:6-phosphogluconate dehydrogenase